MQRGILRGLHGEREEDWKDVCHEVCQKEAEEGPEPGERDRCVEKVICPVGSALPVTENVDVKHLISCPESNMTTWW